jgi:hypothetical protein
MKGNISSITASGSHKSLVAGSNPNTVSSLFSHNYKYDIIVPILLKKRYRSCVR